MPRLIPSDWKKDLYAHVLLNLYMENHDFQSEWGEVRKPYDNLIQQLTKLEILDHVTYLPNPSLPKEGKWLYHLSADRDKLRVYLDQIPPDGVDFGNTRAIDRLRDAILENLVPYRTILSALADRWNLHCDWASERLVEEDLFRCEQKFFKEAGVTLVNRTCEEGLAQLMGAYDSEFPDLTIKVNVFTLLLAGGKEKLLSQIDKRLTEFQETIKQSGGIELPSAVEKHADWWFSHYVLGKSFTDIANDTAIDNPNGGHYPENIRKAVNKFSMIAEVKPLEP